MTAIGTRAIELVRRAGVAHRIHAYESPERHGRARETRPAYGLEAAELAPADLAALTGAIVASITRDY